MLATTAPAPGATATTATASIGTVNTPKPARRRHVTGPVLCAAAALTLAYLAARGALGADMPGAVALVCVALAALAWSRSRWSLPVGAYALAFAGSLAVLSHSADMVPEGELASLRDATARQTAIFEPLTN